MQQEIAEELERERKRNKKELSALEHTNANIARQRDEAQRVVLHLRSLISGQTHHMEHIVRSLGKAPELSDYVEEELEDLPEDIESDAYDPKDASEVGTLKGVKGIESRAQSRAISRASTVDGKPLEGEDVTPEMESHFFSNPNGNKRSSQLSMVDVADRHLREQTDAIAYIIRNISDQCAAAVEGLHLAQDADNEEDHIGSHQASHSTPSEDEHESSVQSSEDVDHSHHLSPHARDERNGSMPPTPDLVHGNRSSTSMSMASTNTTPERHSQSYVTSDLPTKILEAEDEHEDAGSNHSVELHEGSHATKSPTDSFTSRSTGARLSMLSHV